MSTTKNIIIRVTNQGIYFNDTTIVPLKYTNLPHSECRFVDSRPIFWEAKMLGFDKELGDLELQIVNYKPAMVDDFLDQKPKAIVLFITFRDLYWPALNVDLSFYKKSSFLSLLSETMPVNETVSEKSIHMKVQVPFQKLSFGMGFVTFMQKIPWQSAPITVRITNPHLMPEFEYIKPYFQKHFNNRNFDALLVITKQNNQIKSIIATSKQIEAIQDIAIETLKFIKTEQLRKPAKFIKEVDQSLFTADDIFSPFDHQMLGTHPMTQQELMDQIMQWDDIRNQKQLEYLAGSLQHTEHKIRFTLTPKFGFLFVAKGDQMIHYIWEMLNTNATYIWSFDPSYWSTTSQLQKMEEAISFIRNHGRDSYLRNVSASDGVIFRRVLHKGAKSQFVDHFPDWRHAVNESIV